MPRTPTPDATAPDLGFPLAGGGEWTLSEQTPETFTMIVFYRGLHCPMCKKYLKTLTGLLDDYVEAGFSVVAVSMDDADRARQAHEDWELGDLPLGYGLTEDRAEAWGLYLSEAIKEAEPRTFCEPALAWVRPDGRLYLYDVSNSPFARPDLAVLAEKAAWIVENDYPARGARAA